MNFPRSDKLKISTRLLAGFGLLLALTAIMGAMAYSGIANLSALLGDITDHPFQVIDRAERLKANVVAMDRDMLALLHGSGAETVAQNVVRIRDLEQRDRTHLAVIRQMYLGPREDLSRLALALDALSAQRELAIALRQGGRPAEALAAMQPGGDPPQVQVERELQKILAFARDKAAALQAQSDAARERAVTALLATMAGLLLLGLLSAWLISRSITRPMESLRQRMAALAAGDLSVEVPYQDGASELAAIANTVQAFKDAAIKLQGQRWVKSSAAELSRAMQTATSKLDFAEALIGGLTPLCAGGVGIFYQANEAEDGLEILASYGLKKRRSLHTAFKLGEGLVGQAALERKSILLTDVPDDYARITTGAGEAAPRQILVAPVTSQGRVLALVEIGSFQPFTADQEALIDELLPIIALNLEVLERNRRTRELLAQTQQQTEELRASEEELRAQSEQLQGTNEELRQKSLSLQEQTEELRASEEELRAQREELQAANEELEEKGRGLEEQAVLLEKARTDADTRALERDTASRYKSEFLSNMSHELRTPLNSLLILARSLRDNDEGHLNADEVDSASIIYDSGTTLLRLINDILDLSKVEAGKMEVAASNIALEDLASSLRKRFRLMAESKGLEYRVEVEAGLPPAIRSDSGKVDQILNNLVGNAIKFTEQGSIRVLLKAPLPSDRLQAIGLAPAQAVEVEITDTGIGIPDYMAESIFNAFEQVDGTASRRYGGTGLGLTISRRLAQLLGGDVFVRSAEGAGSTFTLILPRAAGAEQKAGLASAEPPAAAALPPMTSVPGSGLDGIAAPGMDDDRLTISPRDETILVIEDDPSFARIVRDLSRRRGYKCLVAGDGVRGLDLARRYLPTGIVLDIGLPGMDGWSVMEQLKGDPATRHIPVHFMSATDSSLRGLGMGAVGYLTKPVSREQIEGAFERIRHFGAASVRRLLLIEDDAGARKSVKLMLGDIDAEIVEEDSGEGALARLRRGEKFDCMILDLGLPGISGLNLLEQCTRENLLVPPVVVYSGRDLSDQDTLSLKEYTDSVVIKGARSPERLVDEVTLFLHSVHSALPAVQQKALHSASAAGSAEDGLAGRSVLVVDDDMRNAFALSKVLRAKGFKVLMAQDGQKALSQLNDTPEVDAVLMDIMMPGMDGYTAIREIRKQGRFKALPVIALTAKAMIGDREKCIEAGASDYLSKPIDIDALLDMLRVQLNLA